MKLMAAIGLAVAALAGHLGTSAIREQANERELLAADCIAVFGADQASLASRLVPACLIEEAPDDCAARLAGIEQERHHVDGALHRFQGARPPRRRGARTLPDAGPLPGRDVVLGRPLETV